MTKGCSVINGLQLVEIANFTTINYRDEIEPIKYDPSFNIYIQANINSKICNDEVYIVIDNKKIYTGSFNSSITIPATLYTTSEISIRIRSQYIKTITKIVIKDSSSIETVNFIQLFSNNDLSDTFNGCTSLKNVPYIIEKDNNVKNFSRMFRNCYMLLEVPVIYMDNNIIADYMFANTCYSTKSNEKFEQYQNINNTPAQFISAIGMYFNAHINKLPHGNFSKCDNLDNFMAYACLTTSSTNNSYTIDISSASKINNTFANTSNISEIKLINANNISEINDLFNMNESITTVTGLNVVSPSKMNGTFYGAKLLNSIPIINFINTKYALCTFKNCSTLTKINVLNFNNIIDMSSCFEGCEKLKSVPTLSNINNVIRAISSFKNCKQLTNFPNLSLPSCEDITSICSNCINLLSLPVLSNLNNVKYSASSFICCEKASSTSSYSLPLSKTGSYMFANCPKLTTFPNINAPNMVDRCGMYMNCTGITSGSVLFQNTIDASYMFYGCSNITNIPASSGIYKTGNVKNMAHMYEKCTSIVNTPDCLDTSNALNLNCTFKDCTSLETLTLSTSTVETMKGTFDGCAKLHSLTINGSKCPSFSINGCNFNRNELNSLINSLPANSDSFNYIDARNNPAIGLMTVNDIQNAYNKKWIIKPYTYDMILHNSSSAGKSIIVNMSNGYYINDDGTISNSDDFLYSGFTEYDFVFLAGNNRYSITANNNIIKIGLYDSNFNKINILKPSNSKKYTFTLNTDSYIRVSCNGINNCESITITCESVL